ESGTARDPCPAHPKGMTKGDCTTIAVHMRCVLGNPEFAQHCDALAGKSFIEFDNVEISWGHSQPLAKLAACRSRAHAHDPGWHPCCRAAENAGDRRQPVLAHGFFGSNDQRSCAIIDTRSVSGSDRAVLEQRLQLAEGFHRRTGTRMFILVHYDRVT